MIADAIYEAAVAVRGDYSAWKTVSNRRRLTVVKMMS